MAGVLASDVEVIRRAYAALEAGDMDELEQCFAHDAVWHEPGDNIHSGERVGWAEIRDEFLALLGPLSHGTLRTELVAHHRGREVCRRRPSCNGSAERRDAGLDQLRGSPCGPGSSTRGVGHPRQPSRGRCVLGLTAGAL